MLFDLSATKVTNSRFFKRQNKVWRRRQTSGGVVFTTKEQVDLESLVIIKKSGASQHYQPGKLFLSIHKSCDHLADASNITWQLFQTVEEKTIANLDANFQVASSELAQLILETLHSYDITSYVKYASYQQSLVSGRKLAATARL